MEVLGGRLGFLTRDMEDRVILGVMDDLGRPQGSYPESFVSISSFLAELKVYVTFVGKRDIHQTDRHLANLYKMDPSAPW